tara:strand:- start:37 stop:174 length:138 start_codon:yes stop_codon:yes gene_type:complete
LLDAVFSLAATALSTGDGEDAGEDAFLVVGAAAGGDTGAGAGGGV